MHEIHEKLVYIYKHFRLPGYSVADMKVQILERICHSSGNPVNIRLHRRIRELHWIKELGTAAPYGCNDMTNKRSWYPKLPFMQTY